MISTNSSSNGKNGCITTTSECVIWQGPNIDCIDLCTGDTISTVIATLAQELCDLLASVNVNGNVQCIQDWATENEYTFLADHDFTALSDGTASIDDHFNLTYEMICAALACCEKGHTNDPGHTQSTGSSMPAGARPDGLAELTDKEYEDLLAQGAQIEILV